MSDASVFDLAACKLAYATTTAACPHCEHIGADAERWWPVMIAEIERLRKRDAENSELIYLSYLQGMATRDEHVRVALKEVERLKAELAEVRNA